MTPPLGLQHALSALIGDAQLVPCPLPGTALSLWLLDADNMDRAFSQEETRRILHEPPYWSFCWASGLALARYLAAHPEWVAGKRVLDFGAGSGVAGIAAVKAGALEVVACDLDPLALAACRANAELNQVALSYSADFFAEADRFDLILVADVLYDRANLPPIAELAEPMLRLGGYRINPRNNGPTNSRVSWLTGLSFQPVAGGAARPVQLPTNARFMSPSWSPDGRSVYFQSARERRGDGGLRARCDLFFGIEQCAVHIDGDELKCHGTFLSAQFHSVYCTRFNPTCQPDVQDLNPHAKAAIMAADRLLRSYRYVC